MPSSLNQSKKRTIRKPAFIEMMEQDDMIMDVEGVENYYENYHEDTNGNYGDEAAFAFTEKQILPEKINGLRVTIGAEIDVKEITDTWTSSDTVQSSDVSPAVSAMGLRDSPASRMFDKVQQFVNHWTDEQRRILHAEYLRKKGRESDLTFVGHTKVSWRKMYFIMDDIFRLVNSGPFPMPPGFTFLDIGAAPGGASQYLLDQESCFAGIGFTLPESRGGFPLAVDSNRLANNVGHPDRYLCHFGDLLADPDEFQTLVTPKLVNFVFADAQFLGGWKYKHSINKYEQHPITSTWRSDKHPMSEANARLAIICSQIIVGLANLAQGGTFTIRLYLYGQSFSLNEMRLIYILHRYFELQRPFKSEYYHASDLSFYFICTGFKRDLFETDNILNRLQADYRNWFRFNTDEVLLNLRLELVEAEKKKKIVANKMEDVTKFEEAEKGELKLVLHESATSPEEDPKTTDQTPKSVGEQFCVFFPRSHSTPDVIQALNDEESASDTAVDAPEFSHLVFPQFEETPAQTEETTIGPSNTDRNTDGPLSNITQVASVSEGGKSVRNGTESDEQTAPVDHAVSLSDNVSSADENGSSCPKNEYSSSSAPTWNVASSVEKEDISVECLSCDSPLKPVFLDYSSGVPVNDSHFVEPPTRTDFVKPEKISEDTVEVNDAGDADNAVVVEVAKTKIANDEVSSTEAPETKSADRKKDTRKSWADLTEEEEAEFGIFCNVEATVRPPTGSKLEAAKSQAVVPKVAEKSTQPTENKSARWADILDSDSESGEANEPKKAPASKKGAEPLQGDDSFNQVNTRKGPGKASGSAQKNPQQNSIARNAQQNTGAQHVQKKTIGHQNPFGALDDSQSSQSDDTEGGESSSVRTLEVEATCDRSDTVATDREQENEIDQTVEQVEFEDSRIESMQEDSRVLEEDVDHTAVEEDAHDDSIQMVEIEQQIDSPQQMNAVQGDLFREMVASNTCDAMALSPSGVAPALSPSDVATMIMNASNLVSGNVPVTSSMDVPVMGSMNLLSMPSCDIAGMVMPTGDSANASILSMPTGDAANAAVTSMQAQTGMSMQGASVTGMATGDGGVMSVQDACAALNISEEQFWILANGGSIDDEDEGDDACDGNTCDGNGKTPATDGAFPPGWQNVTDSEWQPENIYEGQDEDANEDCVGVVPNLNLLPVDSQASTSDEHVVDGHVVVPNPGNGFLVRSSSSSRSWLATEVQTQEIVVPQLDAKEASVQEISNLLQTDVIVDSFALNEVFPDSLNPIVVNPVVGDDATVVSDEPCRVPLDITGKADVNRICEDSTPMSDACGEMISLYSDSDFDSESDMKIDQKRYKDVPHIISKQDINDVWSTAWVPSSAEYECNANALYEPDLDHMEIDGIVEHNSSKDDTHDAMKSITGDLTISANPAWDSEVAKYAGIQEPSLLKDMYSGNEPELLQKVNEIFNYVTNFACANSKPMPRF